MKYDDAMEKTEVNLIYVLVLRIRNITDCVEIEFDFIQKGNF